MPRVLMPAASSSKEASRGGRKWGWERAERLCSPFDILEFRLISCEERWGAARALFYRYGVITLYKRLDAKLV